jgi:hypothetical protein
MSTPQKPAVPNSAIEDLAAALGQAIRESQPRKRTTYKDALAQNPIPELPQPTFQNSKAVNPRGLSDDTLKKLATIPSGTYLNGLISVIRDVNRRTLDFYYDNYSSTDRRVNFMLAVTSFSDLVNKVHAEATAASAKQ